jgi:hypothetical protein
VTRGVTSFIDAAGGEHCRRGDVHQRQFPSVWSDGGYEGHGRRVSSVDGRAGEDPLVGVMPGHDGSLGEVASAEDPREGAYRSIDSFVEQVAQERARSYQ